MMLENITMQRCTPCIWATTAALLVHSLFGCARPLPLPAFERIRNQVTWLVTSKKGQRARPTLSRAAVLVLLDGTCHDGMAPACMCTRNVQTKALALSYNRLEHGQATSTCIATLRRVLLTQKATPAWGCSGATCTGLCCTPRSKQPCWYWRRFVAEWSAIAKNAAPYCQEHCVSWLLLYPTAVRTVYSLPVCRRCQPQLL